MLLVAGNDAAHLTNSLVVARIQFSLKHRISCTGLCQLGTLSSARNPSTNPAREQTLALLQVTQLRVLFEVELQGCGGGVPADNEFGKQGAVRQLLFSPHQIDIGVG